MNTFSFTADTERGRFFDFERPITITHAPGSLDVLGGLAEHAGGLVLRLPLAPAAHVALQGDMEPTIRMRLLEADGTAHDVSLPCERLAPGGEPIEYSDWRVVMRDFLALQSPIACPEQRRRANPQSPIPNLQSLIAFSAFLVLMREEFVRFAGGVRLLVRCDIPLDEGGRAALAVAVLQALVTWANVRLPTRELALHAQTLARRCLELPDGVAAPATALHATAKHGLLLRCNPLAVAGNPHLPHDVGLWAVQLGEADARPWRQAQVAVAMAGRILSQQLLAQEGAEAATVEPEQRRAARALRGTMQQGYLANLNLAGFAQRFGQLLPESLSAAAFLAQHGPLPDDLLPLEPGAVYPLRAIASHAVAESFRARTAAALLPHAHGHSRDETLALLGELMAQSHDEAATYGLATPAAQRLVQLVQAAGPEHGLWGARACGGGHMVAVLGRHNKGEALHKLVDQFNAETGGAARVVEGVS